MVKRSQRLAERPESQERSQAGRETPAAEPAPATATRRRPYQRPTVQKRRSLAQATLFSGGGLSGTLVA